MEYIPGSYFLVPNRQLIRGLPAVVRSVYFALCDMSDSEGICWPSHKKIGEYAGCKTTAVKTALNALKELNLIESRQRVSEEYGQTSNVYQLMIAPTTSRQTTTPPSRQTTTNDNQTINDNQDITNVISSDAQETEKPNKSNPGINTVIAHFEDKFGIKLKGVRWQRIHAANLIKRYGESDVLQAIEAAQFVRHEQYAPVITDLKDLWMKWDKLATFYQRKQNEQQTQQGVTIITDE